MNEIELAWAAGFFDGEGYIGFKLCGGRRLSHNNPWRQLKLSIGQIDRQVLDRFQTAVGGLGYVRGPNTPKKPTHQPHFEYYITKCHDVKQAMEMLSPYLSPVKKNQYVQAMTQYEAYDKSFIRQTWKTKFG